MKDLNLYKQISNDVWQVFKSYLPDDADTLDFPKSVSKLDEKYRNTEGYDFMQKLLKVYFKELAEVKG